MSIHDERNRRRAEYYGHTEPESAPEPVEEESEPEEDDLAESSLGGGWYQVGDEKVHGKDAALEVLNG